MTPTHAVRAGHGRPVWVAVLACLCVALAACQVGPGPAGTRVQMLWFGANSDGAPTYGVTEAAVISARTGRGDFAVDMSAAGRGGDQWQAAAWTAATVGTMLAGTDPRGLEVSYLLDERIDGPSAGAVLAAGVLADLRGAGPLSQSVTMTGTVLPSGAIGPVGGIPSKLRAAAQAGITTVLLPPGQAIELEPGTGKRVAVADLAAELGITVVPVATVREAVAYLADAGTTPEPTPSPLHSDPLDPSLATLFTEAATAAVTRLKAASITPAPTASGADGASGVDGATGTTTRALEAERQRITSGVALAQTRVATLLAEGRFIDAFTRATLAEREVAAWNARAAAQAVADRAAEVASLEATARTLAADADARITAIIASAGDTPVRFVEQATALPDALCWATDAWAVGTVVSRLIAQGHDTAPPDRLPSAADIGTTAALLAAAQYDIDTYLPFSVQLARAVGRTALADPAAAASILRAYAGLLGDTGQAVLGDTRRLPGNLDSLSLVDDPLAWESAVLSALAGRWQQQAGQGGPASADELNRQASALSTAMSYYVAGATWAATAQLSSAGASRGTFGKSEWETQVSAATAESARMAGLASGSGLDPGYVQWNEGFGRGAATAAAAIGADDAVRLNGLQVQWYGNLQGNMLVSLARSLQPGTAAEGAVVVRRGHVDWPGGGS